MPATAQELARGIGFVQPQIVKIRLRRGEKFRVRGVLAGGLPYELRHEIEDFDQNHITLRLDGEFGKGNIMRDNHVRFPFVPNQPFKLPQPISFGQPDIYVAFITSTASEFRPIAGGALTLAFGEVRDTVPPPPPKK